MKKGGEKMEGLILAARFSLGCNEVALFPERERTLLEFLKSPSEKNADKAKKTLQELRILFPYLSLIARVNNLDPFSCKVVEAYFVGNSLLDNIPPRDIQETIKSIYSRNLVLNSRFVPHHNCHLLIVLPEIEQGNIPLPLLNLCMVRLGKVRKIEKEQISIQVWQAVFSSKRIVLIQRNEIVNRNSVFVEGLKKGDLVAVHWQHICQKLEPKQAKLLEYYTQKAIECATIKGE